MYKHELVEYIYINYELEECINYNQQNIYKITCRIHKLELVEYINYN